MRWSISKICLIVWFSLSSSLFLKAQNNEEDTSRYERRLQKYTSDWNKLIPRYSKLQYAGSIGIVSIGGGWNYYRNHWETDFLFGIVPRNSDKHAMVTFTLKQNYIPFNIRLSNKFSFEPLTCGVFVNTLLDRDFWNVAPDKYPKGYYWFSTRMRIHAFAGERITLNLNREKSWHKSISFFYELSTCDIYFLNAINNSTLKPKDYLSLAFGIKLQIL